MEKALGEILEIRIKNFRVIDFANILSSIKFNFYIFTNNILIDLNS